VRGGTQACSGVHARAQTGCARALGSLALGDRGFACCRRSGDRRVATGAAIEETGQVRSPLASDVVVDQPQRKNDQPDRKRGRGWIWWFRGRGWIWWLQAATILIPVIVFLIGGLLIFWPEPPPPVEASFTRVAGQTRVETAADAARFWLKTPPKVVMTSVGASASVVVTAAQCAAHDDAPLLFIPATGIRNSIVADLIASWGLPMRDQKTITALTPPCAAQTPPGLHTLTENEDVVLPRDLRLRPRTNLEKFVVFAATVVPSVPPRRRSGPRTGKSDYLPDAAVGLALAAHMARDHREPGSVSLVVVPEYLEADPALENSLRAQHGEVLGGIVLGGVGRISDDTQTLLRQILRPPDQADILGALQGSLGDLGGVIAAILALVLGTAASAAAVGAAGSLIIKNTTTKSGETVTEEHKRSNGETGSAADHNPFDVSDHGHPRVTVYVNGGRAVTGDYQGKETLGDATFIKLANAEVVGVDPGHLVKVKAILVPVSKIELATTIAIATPEPTV
jgi:hypothetical protein